MDQLAVLLKLAKLTAAQEALKIVVYQAGGAIILTPEARDAARDYKVVGARSEGDTFTLRTVPVAEGESTDFEPEITDPEAA